MLSVEGNQLLHLALQGALRQAIGRLSIELLQLDFVHIQLAGISLVEAQLVELSQPVGLLHALAEQLSLLVQGGELDAELLGFEQDALASSLQVGINGRIGIAVHAVA